MVVPEALTLCDVWVRLPALHLNGSQERALNNVRKLSGKPQAVNLLMQGPIPWRTAKFKLDISACNSYIRNIFQSCGDGTQFTVVDVGFRTFESCLWNQNKGGKLKVIYDIIGNGALPILTFPKYNAAFRLQDAYYSVCKCCSKVDRKTGLMRWVKIQHNNATDNITSVYLNKLYTIKTIKGLINKKAAVFKNDLGVLLVTLYEVDSGDFSLALTFVHSYEDFTNELRSEIKYDLPNELYV